jgi:hypothetical protein
MKIASGRIISGVVRSGLAAVPPAGDHGNGQTDQQRNHRSSPLLERPLALAAQRLNMSIAHILKLAFRKGQAAGQSTAKTRGCNAPATSAAVALQGRTHIGSGDAAARTAGDRAADDQ